MTSSVARTPAEINDEKKWLVDRIKDQFQATYGELQSSKQHFETFSKEFDSRAVSWGSSIGTGMIFSGTIVVGLLASSVFTSLKFYFIAALVISILIGLSAFIVLNIRRYFASRQLANIDLALVRGLDVINFARSFINSRSAIRDNISTDQLSVSFLYALIIPGFVRIYLFNAYKYASTSRSLGNMWKAFKEAAGNQKIMIDVVYKFYKSVQGKIEKEKT